MPFKKYNLSESQLIKITRLCNQEQGNIKGCRAEASLMSNLFELHGSSYGSGASGLYNYVRNGGWFASAAYHMDNGSYTQNQLEAVRDVLVNGNRFFPESPVIDEHDCISDLRSVKNNGVSIDKHDRSQYKKGISVCSNVYGSVYTFYCFPDGVDGCCDPFGYTEGSISDNQSDESEEPKNLREEYLANGSTGDAVCVLQSLLNYHLQEFLDVDGEFGKCTENALICFQKRAFPDDEKQWDGICYTATWNKLLD